MAQKAAAAGPSRASTWLTHAMSVHLALLERLRDEALMAPEDDTACLAWLALSRHAGRRLVSMRSLVGSRAYLAAEPQWDAFRAAIRAYHEQADERVAGYGDEVQLRARLRVGMRLALVGKGGAGKSMISGTLARLLARMGRPVLTADMDTNHGLAFSLGLPLSDAGLPAEGVTADPVAAYGWRLADGVSSPDAIERFSTASPDGVRFLSHGKISQIDKSDVQHSIVALQQILLNLGEPGWDVIADLEAGTSTPFERYHAFAGRVLLIVGPSWKSALTVRRLLPIIGSVRTTIVANRDRPGTDHPGLVPEFRIPYDPAAADAERMGVAPLDHCPDSPAIRAIARMADSLLAQEVEP